MTSALYATLAAFILIWLTFQVIHQRRANKVALGDGGVDALKNAMGAHGNAVDTIPITLILLFALEYNGGHLILVHVAGIVFIIGRFIHARGLLAANLKKRVLGMQLTLYPIVTLAVLNLLYLPYSKIFG